MCCEVWLISYVVWWCDVFDDKVGYVVVDIVGCVV